MTMNINPNFWPSLVIFLLLFGASMVVLRLPLGKGRKSILGGVSLLLAGLSFSILAPYFSDSIGENPQYAQFRSQPYVEILVVLIAPALAFLASCQRKPRSRLMGMGVILLLGLGYVSLPFIKPIIRPLAIQNTMRWQDGVVLQSTSSTCGPASMVTVLKQYGVTDTESHIAQQAFTSGSGTENWYLARYAKTQGLQYQFLNIAHLKDVPPRSIIGVKLGKAGHYIVLLNQQNGVYSIADSLSGLHHLTQAEFEQRYVFTGFVLSVRPTP